MNKYKINKYVCISKKSKQSIKVLELKNLKELNLKDHFYYNS